MARQHFAGKQLQKFRNTIVSLATSEVNLLDGSAQASHIPDLAMTYTANDPATTANSAITVADATSISDAEIAEFMDEVEAKINAILSALESFGVVASS